jgi:hypothetical protein
MQPQRSSEGDMGPKKNPVSCGRFSTASHYQGYDDEEEHRAARRARRVFGVCVG